MLDERVIRTFVVSDDPLARGGLRSLLFGVEDIEVTGDSDAGSGLEPALRSCEPDVVLWDLGLDWLDEGQWPVGVVPAVLALVAPGESASEVLRRGLAGAVGRDIDGRRLAVAVRTVAEGLLVIEPTLAHDLTDGLIESTELAEPLTSREQEVLRLLGEGLTNRALAQRLGISPNTVKFHVNAILWKLDARSRTEAVVRAARLGLLHL